MVIQISIKYLHMFLKSRAICDIRHKQTTSHNYRFYLVLFLKIRIYTSLGCQKVFSATSFSVGEDCQVYSVFITWVTFEVTNKTHFKSIFEDFSVGASCSGRVFNLFHMVSSGLRQWCIFQSIFVVFRYRIYHIGPLIF